VEALFATAARLFTYEADHATDGRAGMGPAAPLVPDVRVVRSLAPVFPTASNRPADIAARLSPWVLVAMLDEAVPWRPEPSNGRTWTCAELLRATFEQKRCIVDGLIADCGLTVLAGAPKVGKSWWALQAAEGVAAGVPVLGCDVRQGPVLYFALEDSPARIKERLGAHRVTEPLPISFDMELRHLDRGGMAHLEQRIVETGARLCIVDRISAARSARPDENDSGPMNGLLAGLRRLGQDRQVGILAIHHNRKGATGDVVADMRGSNAVTAAADLLVGLSKRDSRVTLQATGRDVPEQELALRFTPDVCAWELLGDAREVARQEAEEAFLGLLNDVGEVDIKGAVEALKGDRTKWQKVAKRLHASGDVDVRTDGARHVYRRAGPPGHDSGGGRTPRTPRTDDPSDVQGVLGVRLPADSAEGECPTGEETRPTPSHDPGHDGDLTAREVLSLFPDARRMVEPPTRLGGPSQARER
jgi:hypothetical protein